MCVSNQTIAQSRIIQTINSNWQFYKGDIPTDGKAIEWTNVSLPHSFNSHDVCDDEPGYYRGPTWYKKTIFVPDSWKAKDTYLFFEGVAEVATVYVNGKFVGKHIGSFTAFNFKINDYLSWDKNGANEVSIKVDNSHNEDIPPLSADFTFYGGIYRDVYLSVINPIHFDADNKASKGVFITTPTVNNDKAVVNMKGIITNTSSINKQLKVEYTITDKDGKTTTKESQQLTVNALGKVPFEHTFKSISKPNLWSPENPYLYKISAVIKDASSGEVLDEMMNPLGLRWFEFTADKGFFLNGKHYKLWGTSRHQDNMNIGNALPDALHVKDIQLLKDLGANFLRVAHYPQDPALLEACDRLGILTSVETPIVNAITETDAFSNNCLNMQVEMIRQNFNHPSVIIWGYMNEVLLRLRYTDDKARQQIYFANVKKLATSIDSISRLEDPSRYTMIPFHGDLDLYIRTGMAQIPQIVGWNQYQGWYSGRIEGFGENMDKHRRLLPNKPVMVTEFGADGDPRLHSFSPERFDKTLEYETYFHQVYLKAIRERDFISGAAMWNLADFNAEGRAESMPHINNKGLLTMDRKPKDAYLYYQSQLLKAPFIRIGSRSWTLRSGTEDADGAMVCTEAVQVFSNEPTVTLEANGKTIGTAKTVDGIAVFDVPFVDGNNKLEVATTIDGKTYTDEVEIKFMLLPVDLRSTKTPFKEINISLGDKRFFIDDNLQQVWLPEKPYSPGNWGYVGGKVFTLKDTRRQPYGSDKNILQTEYDPIYQTQRVGIDQFKLDVPDGKYEVTLLFAELLSTALKDVNIYNLDTSHIIQAASKTIESRSFDVFINQQKVMDGLSNNNYLVPETAVSAKFEIEVMDGKGIVVDFKPIEGEAILNGIQVRKVY
jgi:beta-galactosidase